MAKIYAVIRGCTKCGWCVNECRAGAIVFDQDGAHIDPAKCTGCGKCYDNCASEAIAVIVTDGKGKTGSVDDVAV